jgi:hypothetical protein
MDKRAEIAIEKNPLENKQIEYLHFDAPPLHRGERIMQSVPIPHLRFLFDNRLVQKGTHLGNDERKFNSHSYAFNAWTDRHRRYRTVTSENQQMHRNKLPIRHVCVCMKDA